eukprot:scaffold287617_cov16-Tisochrysis_lutea.AAC.1
MAPHFLGLDQPGFGEVSLRPSSANSNTIRTFHLFNVCTAAAAAAAAAAGEAAAAATAGGSNEKGAECCIIARAPLSDSYPISGSLPLWLLPLIAPPLLSAEGVPSCKNGA